ncbi:unnamed protein product [Chrysoparadoxa australica]
MIGSANTGSLKTKHQTLSASQITPKTFIEMNRTSSGITGVLETLTKKLQLLEEEIKTEERGKQEFERLLEGVCKRRDELQKRVDTSKSFLSQYDADIGPFEKKYKTMTAEIGDIYESAKAGHASGLEVLKAQFGYHPEFKRPTDTFSATPFVPR